MFVQSDLAPSNLRDLKWLLSVDGSSTYALDGCRNGMHFLSKLRQKYILRYAKYCDNNQNADVCRYKISVSESSVVRECLRLLSAHYG